MFLVFFSFTTSVCFPFEDFAVWCNRRFETFLRLLYECFVIGETICARLLLLLLTAWFLQNLQIKSSIFFCWWNMNTYANCWIGLLALIQLMLFSWALKMTSPRDYFRFQNYCSSETHLEPSRTYLMGLFCKKALSEILNWF